MLKIRLMRIGAKKKPFYRVVVVDERAKRTGGYVELLGTYNPLTEPKDIKLKQDRIDYWVKKGAQMSEGFLRIIGKAPQRPPRKPKKQKQESSDKNQAEETKAEVATQEEKAEETPAEETTKSSESEATEVKSEETVEATKSDAAKAIGEVELTGETSGALRTDEQPTEESGAADRSSEPTELKKQDQPSDQSETK